MEFDKKGEEHQDFGFEQHPIGWYVFKMLEGVGLITKEDSPGMSLMLPFESVEALSKPKPPKKGVAGKDDAIGSKLTHFIVLITKKGEESKGAEKFVASLLTITDTIDHFRKKFPDGVELTDEKFIDELKLKLPDAIIRGSVKERKDQQGEMRSELESWERHGKAGKKKQPAKKKEDPPAEEKEEPDTSGAENPDDDGWD